jgi:hypothetical protein
MGIQKNGSTIGIAGSISSIIQQVRKILYLNGSTDYVNIINNGSNANARTQEVTRSWFQARWLGD